MPKLTHRFIILASIFSAFALIFTVRLVDLQLIRGDYYATLAEQRRSSTQSVAAARGSILDRYGNVLAEDRAGLSLVLDGTQLPLSDVNTVLAAVVTCLCDAGQTWNDTLPLSLSAPWTFTGTADGVYSMLKLPHTASAETVWSACVARYGAASLPDTVQRHVVGIRYTMERAGFNAVTPYVLASDISQQTAAVIQAHPSVYAGVRVQTVPVREYVAGTTAAHLIGMVGRMSAEEYDERKVDGYTLTDTIGKSGVEAAMEETLRGTAGQQQVLWNADGVVEEIRETVSAVAGNSVELTIDRVLQDTIQTALEDTITALRKRVPTEENRYVGQDVRSGSAVLLDVHTGGILAAASAPGYNLSTYTQMVSTLLEDADQPLFNRALYGTFPCGSVIKPAVAIAGLSEGKIKADENLLVCDGVYHQYESVGFAPKCLGKHGEVTLSNALSSSCNVYFFELGRLLGIDRLNTYLTAFGLGQSTGIELGEARGILASPATKQGVWFAGDTCQCAIGQMDQRFTPLQLAAYAMTLANEGKRHQVHLVQRILRHDGTVEFTYQPTVMATVPAEKEAFEAVRQGMQAVTQVGGTAYSAFRDAPYTVAAKTGTAQNGRNRSDHGVFIGYAPADAPEVALAVVMENGTSAPATMLARSVFDAFFAQK